MPYKWELDLEELKEKEGWCCYWRLDGVSWGSIQLRWLNWLDSLPPHQHYRNYVYDDPFWLKVSLTQLTVLTYAPLTHTPPLSLSLYHVPPIICYHWLTIERNILLLELVTRLNGNTALIPHRVRHHWMNSTAENRTRPVNNNAAKNDDRQVAAVMKKLVIREFLITSRKTTGWDINAIRLS